MLDSLITVKPFSAVGQDERGVTAEYSLPRAQDNFVFITRKAGTFSGNTYHEGKTPATAPKIFVILAGKIRFSYRKVGTDEVGVVDIDEPSTIEVSPMVTHKVEVLEDCILLECNAIADIQNDRIREEV